MVQIRPLTQIVFVLILLGLACSRWKGTPAPVSIDSLRWYSTAIDYRYLEFPLHIGDSAICSYERYGWVWEHMLDPDNQPTYLGPEAMRSVTEPTIAWGGSGGRYQMFAHATSDRGLLQSFRADMMIDLDDNLVDRLAFLDWVDGLVLQAGIADLRSVLLRDGYCRFERACCIEEFTFRRFNGVASDFFQYSLVSREGFAGPVGPELYRGVGE